MQAAIVKHSVIRALARHRAQRQSTETRALYTQKELSAHSSKCSARMQHGVLRGEAAGAGERVRTGPCLCL